MNNLLTGAFYGVDPMTASCSTITSLREQFLLKGMSVIE